MARPKKVGLDYFPLDCLPDEKLRGLDTIHENDGFAWFIKFLQSAYQTEDGEVDCSGLFGELMAKNSRITLEKQDRIIKTCLDLKLLYRTPENLLTSHGIKTRMGAVSKERAAAVERKYQRELEKEKESKSKKSKEKDCPHSSANNDSYSANNRKAGDADGPITPEANAQLEESPVHGLNESGAGRIVDEPQPAPVILPDHLTEIWPDYLEMRRRIRKTATHKAESLALKTLQRLSTDPKIQIKIIEQSIENSWQGLFELKGPLHSQGAPTRQDRALERPAPAPWVSYDQRQREADVEAKRLEEKARQNRKEPPVIIPGFKMPELKEIP
jgi:hypothetical protein